MLFFKNKEKISQKENEQKDTYVASIVHDLKNPLIAHSRILETIIRKTNEDLTKEYCKQMLSSTRILLQLVFSISDTYKYNSGNVNYHFEEINLLEMVQAICLDLSYLTEEESLIEIKSTGDCIINADKLHIHRVISNLISNAIRYKKEGTRILVEINSVQKHLSFCVTNQGSYIKTEVQKELFKKYFSKNTKFNSQSTGLGLYLSDKIIRAHKGNMFVNSKKDGTNTFGFIIPVKKISVSLNKFIQQRL